MRRALAATAYATFARHLPWSPRPFGRSAKAIRGWLAGHMLDYCGTAVNVEHGAIFGSGKGTRLGDRSDIGMDALFIGPVHIGNDVMMGPRCILLASAHAYADLSTPMNHQGFLPDRPIIIEDDVWIGAGTVILPGRTLGRGCIVGAGAVVTRDIGPYDIVAGNPAVVVGTRRAEQVDGARSPGA